MDEIGYENLDDLGRNCFGIVQISTLFTNNKKYNDICKHRIINGMEL